MPQLNVLPISVSQNIELKDESTSINSVASKDDFSQYIDLHLAKNQEAERSVKVDSINVASDKPEDKPEVKSEAKSKVNVAQNSSSQIESSDKSKSPDDSVENSDAIEQADAAVHLQKIAASGNKDQTQSNKIDQKAILESERLMSFLTKADNTLINQPVDTSSIISSSEQGSSEQGSVEQKAHYEAQLLLNASHLVADLSAVAKALEKEQEGIALSSAITEQTITEQTNPAEELLLSDAAKAVSKEVSKEASKETPSVNLAVDSQIEFINKDDKQAGIPLAPWKSVENKAEFSDLKPGSITEGKVTNTSNDKTNTVLSELKAELKTASTTEGKVPNISNEKANAVLSELKAELETTSTTEGKVPNISNEKANAVLSELKPGSTTDAQVTPMSSNKTNTAQLSPNQSSPPETLVDRALVTKNDETTSLTAEQEITQQVKIAPIQISNEKTSQNRVQVDVAKSLEKTDNVMATQVNVAKEIQPEKIASLTDELLTEADLTKSSEVTLTEVKTANEKSNQAAANLNKSALPSNQSFSTSSDDLSHDEVTKAQAKQDDKTQLSADQSQQKTVAQNEAGELVQDKVSTSPKIASTKIEPFANSYINDVSAKVTQTPQAIIEQQSAEMLNVSVATEVSQSQKTNAQLHQETISLFRKDFTEAVKDKVMLMISQKLQRFDITLDPPELGNMQVRVNLQGEQATVNFVVQSQQTKDALEQNMHKLRDLLAEQGVDVGDANVEQQSQQSTDSDEFTAGYNSQMEDEIDNMAKTNDVVTHTLSAQMIDSSSTTVDYYA